MAEAKRVGVLKRRRRPGECALPRVAIRNHCLECVGWESGEVQKCSAPACWLWPYRLGYKKGATPQDAIKHELPLLGKTEFPDEVPWAKELEGPGGAKQPT